MELQWLARTVRREIEVHDGSQRVARIVWLAGGRFHRHRWREVQDMKQPGKAIAAHVPKRAAAEIHPPPPDEGQISRVERTLSRGPKPHIPIEILGHGHRSFRSVYALRPKRP